MPHERELFLSPGPAINSEDMLGEGFVLDESAELEALAQKTRAKAIAKVRAETSRKRNSAAGEVLAGNTLTEKRFFFLLLVPAAIFVAKQAAAAAIMYGVSAAIEYGVNELTSDDSDSTGGGGGGGGGQCGCGPQQPQVSSDELERREQAKMKAEEEAMTELAQSLITIAEKLVYEKVGYALLHADVISGEFLEKLILSAGKTPADAGFDPNDIETISSRRRGNFEDAYAYSPSTAKKSTSGATTESSGSSSDRSSWLNGW